MRLSAGVGLVPRCSMPRLDKPFVRSAAGSGSSPQTNTRAQRFYARNGMTLAAVHVNAIERSRELKPGIPLYSDDGSAIRDELEYELLLDPTPWRA